MKTMQKILAAISFAALPALCQAAPLTVTAPIQVTVAEK
jgi:photosystem II stability/assembly factor-like uncharacterized protein